MPNAVTTERWYIIAGIDVLADSLIVQLLLCWETQLLMAEAPLQTRITAGLTFLPIACRQIPDTAHIAVLNHGIGGNAVVAGGLGPSLQQV